MTTVTYTAFDGGGNTASCSFTITINDQESPIINCPGLIMAGPDPGLCSNSTVNIGMATATDNCGIASITNDAPMTFPIGTTTVIWTASDVNGNTATCSQDVVIIDNENPTIICPPDVTACTSGDVNLGSPTTGDNCGVMGVSNNAPGSYPIGTTIVTWTVTDNSGNTATCDQQVMIDAIPPTIICPSDVTACHTDSVSLGTPTTGDNCGVLSLSNNAPGTFPSGTTIVTWTVTDLAGNMATCDQSVTIDDTDPPMITCPNVDAFDADPNMCSKIVNNNLAPVVTDCNNFTVTYNITGATTGSGNDDATGTEFFVGQSTVTYYALDNFGNIDSCSILIQVNDSQNPVINCPSDVVIFVPSGTVDTVVNSIGASASDNCMVDQITYNTTGALNISGNGDISGTAFPPGITNITYTVSDVNGNVDSCTFIVNISLVLNNMIACPGNQNVNNDANLCSAVVNGIDPIILINPALVDNIQYTLTGATTGSGMTDASGTSFNVGTTTVEYILTDNSNNMDTCSFQVTVVDTENPVSASLPDCRALVNWAIPLPSDNCNLAQIITTHNPNDTFDLGSTAVSYIAIDSAGNIGSCDFNIIVVDDIPPSFTCPADISIGTDPGLCTGTATWNPIIATDNCDPAPVISCTFNSGDSFPIGLTTVTCTATDASGNMAVCLFNVVVVDSEPPVVNGCPPNLTINTDQNTCQAIFSWTEPTFTDLCSNPVSVSSTHSPGDTFQVGTTTIFYIGVDAVGNSAICSFDLTVADNEPPVPICPSSITVPSMVKECGNVVTWPPPFATDDCDNTVIMIPDIPPGSFFPVGTTTVTYTATDNSGNTAQCSFEVTVEDITPPEFVCHENIVIGIDGTIVSDNSGAVVSITPNATCDSIIIDYLDPPVTDNCNIDSFGIIAGLPSGAVFPIGTTSITYLAIDDSDNSAACNFDIIILPLPAVMVTINPSDSICEGQDITLMTDVTTAGTTFSWENLNSGWTDNVAEPMISDISLGDTGIYSVTVTYPSGCTAVGSAILSVSEACEVVVSSNSPLCSRENLELFADVDTSCNVLSYSWIGPGFTSNMQNPIIPDATPANSGTYIVTVEFDGGCSVTESINIEITLLSAPTINTSCGSDICFGTSCLLSGTQYNPTPDAYIWEAIPSAGAGLPMDTDNNEITITPTLPGTYIYNYSVEINGCISEVATALVFVHAEPITVIDNFEIDFETTTEIDVVANDTFSTSLGPIISVISGPSNGSLTNNGDGTFSYTPDFGFIGTDQFLYEICYDCEADLCSNAFVNLEVIDNGDCVVPTLITPNTDGVNDELFINCLESGLYPNNELTILNIWGHVVFKASPYQNNWFGTYDNKDLPDGTYYYIFKRDNNSEEDKGALTIFR
jgi:gliding motility-associated-like protein